AVAPEEAATHFYGSLFDAFDNNLSDALDEIDRAEKLGLPAAQAQAVRSSIEAAQPWYAHAWRWLKPILLAWVAILALLPPSGAILSRAAMRSASRLPKEASGRAHGIDALFRRAYRVVLWVACVFYYASIPLVLASVVGLGGGAIYAFFAIGR